MDLLLIRIALAIMATLGTLHLLYTLLDLRNPKRFAPTDRTLLAGMHNTSIRLRGANKSFWLAYMGFNASHSLGILVYAVVFATISVVQPDLLFLPIFSAILIGAAFLYAVMAHFFWFSIPFIGATLSTVLLAAGVAFHIFS